MSLPLLILTYCLWPMCSVPECRQTPGGLHHQKSKAQGDTVPSDLFVSLQAAIMAMGLLSFCSSLGRTWALSPAEWQTNLPMCSVPECRQTPGGLHHQRSKAQGDTVPSDPFLSRQATSMAVGLPSFCSSLGRTQALSPAGWKTKAA